MGSASIIVIGASTVFYLISFGLALGAMARRSQGDLTVVDEDLGTLKCQYTTDIATGFAAGSFVFLLVAQVLVMIVTKCLCCGSGYKPGGARLLGVILFIFSWIAFIISSSALLAGASQNKIQTKRLYDPSEGNITCKEVQKSLFAAASAFTFITMVMTEIYYVVISGAREDKTSFGPSVGMSAYT